MSVKGKSAKAPKNRGPLRLRRISKRCLQDGNGFSTNPGERMDGHKHRVRVGPVAQQALQLRNSTGGVSAQNRDPAHAEPDAFCVLSAEPIGEVALGLQKPHWDSSPHELFPGRGFRAKPLHEDGYGVRPDLLNSFPCRAVLGKIRASKRIVIHPVTKVTALILWYVRWKQEGDESQRDNQQHHGEEDAFAMLEHGIAIVEVCNA